MRPALLVLLLTAWIGSAHAAFTTGLRRDLPAGAGPSAVVTGDFDLDGNADLAVTERDVDSLSVWFGAGTGAFGGRTRYATGDFPQAIAAGDLNGDGFADLAIANGASNSVTLYLGLAHGAFGNRFDFPVGAAPTGLVLADANSDTRLDVVVANTGSNTVTILVGAGAGSGLTGSSVTLQAGTGCRAVAAGDLDWNGVTDLVTANTAADSISVFLGLPAGGFAPRQDLPVTDQPSAVGISDFNVDGRPDVLVACASGWLVPFFNVNGSLVQGPLYPAGNGAIALAITDIELPGEADVVLGHSTSASLTYFRGSPGNLLAGPLQGPGAGSGVLGVAAADFDGDGFRDLVATTLSPPAVSVFMAFNGPFVRTDRPVGTDPHGVAVADLDGDSDLDFAVASTGTPSLTTYVNDGAGGFGGRVDVPAPIGVTDMVTADFNGDTKADLAVNTFRTGVADTNRVSVYLNQGSGITSSRADYDVGLGDPRMGLALGDVTHDGKLDLVTSHQNTTLARILAGNGLGAFPAGPALTTFNSPTVVDVVDVDGNGWPDVFVGGSASFSDGRVCAFIADGAGGFAPRVDYTVGAVPSAIAHGDFDEDGKVDLAVGNLASGDVRILRGNGTGGFTAGATVPLPGGQLFAVATTDLNGDGDLDLVVGRGGPSMGIVYGRGDGSFSPFTIFQVPSTQMGIAVGDLDGNTVPDLVVSNNETANVSVLLGLRRSRTTLTVSPNPSAVGQSLALSAFVTPPPGMPYTPIGSVRFFDGTTLLGVAALVNGVATLQVSGDYPWDRTFSAAYLSDAHYLGSWSPPVSHFTFVPTVGTPPAVGALALAPLGNPARGLRLRVGLAGTAPARLTVHDVRGRHLATLPAVRAGVVDVTPGTPLAPGVYLVRLAQGLESVTARVVVL